MAYAHVYAFPILPWLNSSTSTAILKVTSNFMVLRYSVLEQSASHVTCIVMTGTFVLAVSGYLGRADVVS